MRQRQVSLAILMTALLAGCGTLPRLREADVGDGKDTVLVYVFVDAQDLVRRAQPPIGGWLSADDPTKLAIGKRVFRLRFESSPETGYSLQEGSNWILFTRLDLTQRARLELGGDARFHGPWVALDQMPRMTTSWPEPTIEITYRGLLP